ncbi:MAG: glycosyltransferase [bacterium]|nr:glycosyltransferase [bacterium]
MKKILIVSLRSGQGHLMAAKAIEQEFNLTHPQIEVKNIDFLDYATILSKEFYGKWYLDVVNAVPKFYGWLYENIDPSSSDIRLFFDRINAQDFQTFLFDYDPDLVIATHFVPGNIATFWKTKYQKRYKTAMIVTDYEAHNLWSDKLIDRYFVPTKEVSNELSGMAIEENKIFPTGIPIDRKFSKKYKIRKIRRKLGVDNNFTVLVTSGGCGVGDIKKIIDLIQDIPGKINILAMTGHNKELFTRISNIPSKVGKNKMVFPFVDNAEELMSVADIIIGKPGGLTVSEALALGRPIIIINPIPGQEDANANFLTRNLAGLQADDIKELGKIILTLIDKPRLIKQLKENAKKISKSKAASLIVEKAIELIQ